MEREYAKRGSDSGENKSQHSGEDAKKNGNEPDPARSPSLIVEPEVEKDSLATSTERTQQNNDVQGTRTGITAAQMKAALTEIMDPTYVAVVKIPKDDIQRAEDGLRDVIK